MSISLATHRRNLLEKHLNHTLHHSIHFFLVVTLLKLDFLQNQPWEKSDTCSSCSNYSCWIMLTAHDATFKKAIDKNINSTSSFWKNLDLKNSHHEREVGNAYEKLEKNDFLSFFCKASHCLPVHFGISPSNSFSPRASSQFASSHNQMARRILP